LRALVAVVAALLAACGSAAKSPQSSPSERKQTEVSGSDAGDAPTTTVPAAANPDATDGSGSPAASVPTQVKPVAETAPVSGTQPCPGVTAATGGPELALAYPANLRVFQRDASATGTVAVGGTLPAGADCVEARAFDAQGSVLTDWAALTVSGSSFSGGLRLKNGGWYRLEVRAVKGGLAGPMHTVDKVGVGELFITAGQSNSTFFGEKPQSAASGLVSYFDGATWTPCADPLPAVDPQSPGGSPWCLLGDLLAKSWGVPVAFNPEGWGGSALSAWQPDAPNSPGGPGVLYKRLVEKLAYFGKGGVRAVLWHQGETNVSLTTPADEYARELKVVIDGTRTAAGFDVPWLVAEVSYSKSIYDILCAKDPTNCNARIQGWRDGVLAGQRQLVDGKTIFKGSTSDTLIGDNRWDGVHMSVKGLAAHAQQWYDAIAAAFVH
jgi:hypothetical protein